MTEKAEIGYTPSQTSAALRSDELPIVPARRYGRWISGAVMLLLVLLLLKSLALNPNLQWSVVGTYFTGPSVLAGVLMTIKLTILSIGLGFALGTVVALMRLSSNPVFVAVGWTYTWLFRAVPTLVQLFIWYNIAALYPHLSLSLPWVGEVYSAPTNTLISPFTAALLALVLHEGAYASEVIRSGIIGVNRGQTQAARALGMGRLTIMRRIILPQAMRTILPPAGNLVIGQLKTTSVVSVIALQDLLYSTQVIYQRTYEVIPLLLVATLWYIIMTSVLTVIQHFIEVYYGRGRAEARGTRELLAGVLKFGKGRRAEEQA